MSDGSIDAAQEIYLHNLLLFFAASFFFYDHLITFGKEVTYLWLRPKTQSAYWFFFNRYFAFLGNIVVIVLEQMDLSSDIIPLIELSSFQFVSANTLGVESSTCLHPPYFTDLRSL
ncbi:hypothetical protein E4T56_gene7158 [Termitomyces sp. T112]|nr:hypothetical protein E4T56_gene7158 [Termitomyces sp. T112]